MDHFNEPVAIGSSVLCTLAIYLIKRWMNRVDTRLDRSVDKEELQRIERQLGSALNEIKETLKEQNKQSKEHRHNVANSLHTIQLKVAVIQTQMGDPPTGDTGTFKERSSA